MKEIEMYGELKTRIEGTAQVAMTTGQHQSSSMAGAVRQSTPTEQAVERLQAEITGMSLALDLLIGKLRPVQRDENAKNASDPMPASPAHGGSPLVIELCRQADRIANLAAYVHSQAAQLEI